MNSNEKLIESLSSFAITPQPSNQQYRNRVGDEFCPCKIHTLHINCHTLCECFPFSAQIREQPTFVENFVKDFGPMSSKPISEQLEDLKCDEEMPGSGGYEQALYCQWCDQPSEQEDDHKCIVKSVEDPDVRVGSKAHIEFKDDCPSLVQVESITINEEPIEKEYFKLQVAAPYGKQLPSLDTAKETADKFTKSVEERMMAEKAEAARRRLIELKIQELELELLHAAPKVESSEQSKPKSKTMMYADEIKAKTKQFAGKNAEFMKWYQMNVNNGDVEKDYLQAINWLVQRYVACKTEEERKDWEIVQEVFEENTRIFREKVRVKMDEINKDVTTTSKAREASLRFNGFLYLTIMIPTVWYDKLNATTKGDGKAVRKFFDCRKIAPEPHKDETVQLNPELSVVQDKAFAEAYIQYDKVLNRVMNFINGPATTEVVFFNGALIEPLLPNVITKMLNAQKMGEEFKLDSLLSKLCVQLVPHVVVVEFVSCDRLDVKKDIMEHRGYHLEKMGWLAATCKSIGILAAHK